MKAKRLRIALMYVLAALFTAVAGFALSACTKEPEAKAGDEAGVYYYDAEDDVYHVTLGEDLSLKLDIRGTTTTGVFSREGEKLTFNYETKEAAPELPLEAEYRDNAVILSYDGAEMRFLRKEYYTVKFEVEAGSVSDVSVLNGKTVAKPADPVREGYRFYGWYTDENCTTPFLFGTQAVREDTTLYGHWAKQTEGELVYTVDFDLGYEGAEEIPAMDTVGGKLYHVQTPERDGHVFSGWWVSMYESRDKLSYAFADGETEFKANTTLFALWDNDAPTVNVNANGASWASVGPAVNYEYEVTGPEGFRTMHETIGSTNLAIDFANAPAGEYTVKVTANGKTAVRSYANKTLERVSLFTVAEPSVLLFNNVEHATKYLLTVDCGNPAHNHTELDNGNSTHYSFVNCEMQQGGIKFKVKAVGNGYASSESEWFVYDRTLGAVTGLTVDETEEKAVWNSVPFATNYIVSVNCGNSSHTHDLVDNGSATSFSLKNCGAGTITVKVYPKTKGYNSPLATEYEYEKKSLASPDGLQVNGSTLTWNGVQGANGYEVRVGDQTMSASGTSLDLSTSSVSWTAGGDYSISVRAMGQGSAASSVWSDELDVRYRAMGESLTYYRNRVSWKPVVGATRYEVKVNGGQIVNVDEGNSAEVTLTRAGDNTIEVRFTDGKKYSEWVKLNVYAYTVEFDARSGQSVPEQYVAAGDKVNLPETTRTGYEIDGWYNAPGGAADNAKEYTDEYFAEGQSIMLFANWTPKHYTVKYNDTNGIGETAEVVFGQPFKFEVPMSDTGLTFCGWFAAPHGGGNKQYTDANGVSMSAWDTAEDNITVYAYWAEVFKYTPVVVSGTTTGYAVTKGAEITALDEVTIPATYNGMAITTVNSLAFDRCTNLTKVRIPDCVTLLSYNAFRNCSAIEEFEIYHVDGVDENTAHYVSVDGMVVEKFDIDDLPSDRLTLFPVAREGSIRIPDGITTISGMVIANSKVSRLTFPASVTRLDANAVYGCQQLTEVVFESPEETPSAALTLAAKAFYSCSNLKKIAFPSHLGETNFNGTNSVFSYCFALSEAAIAEGNELYSSWDGMILSADGTTLVYCPFGREGTVDLSGSAKLATIGSGAFDNCTKLTGIDIPVFITTVGEKAFRGCTALAKVTFKGGTSVGDVVIGASAFADCKALKEVAFEEGSNVTEIGDSAFANSGLENVVLPATVVKIDNSAFNGCGSLESVVMTNAADEVTVELGTAAFANCAALISFTISKNVTEMPDGIFAGSDSLKELVLDPGNTSFKLEQGVLFDYDMTKIVYYPAGKDGSFTVPESITEIGANVFKNNKSIQGIIIPGKVTKVAAGAFYGCTALTEVTFNEDGTEELVMEDSKSDSEGTFGGCVSLVKIHLPARLKKIPNFLLANKVTETGSTAANTVEAPATALTTVEFGDKEHVSELTTIGTYAFKGNWLLSEIAIPATVTELKGNSFNYTGITSLTVKKEWTFSTDFMYTRKLASLTVESGVTAIAANAFKESAITKLELPASVLSIGNAAFSGNTALQSVTWAANNMGQTVGDDAFTSCTSLKSFTFPNTVEKIGANVFNGCKALTEVNLGTGSATYAEGAADGSGKAKTGKILLTLAAPSSATKGMFTATGVTSLTIPARVSAIPAFFFAGTSSALAALETVTFEDTEDNPVSVTSFGDNAFSYTNLKSLEVPATVKTIGVGALRGNGKLTVLTFAEKSALESAGNYAFAGNIALENVVLPDSLTKLGENAFDGCTSLGSVTLKGVETIGKKAFNGCKALTSVTVAALKTIEEGAFTGCAALEQIDLKNTKLESVGATAFTGTALTSIELPSTVTTIGKDAFKGVETLASVTFCEGLKELGESAFEGTGVKTVALPNSLQTMGRNAFASCASLTAFTMMEVAEGADKSAHFAAESGILYDAEKKNILIVPAGKTDKVVIPATVTLIGEGAFYNSSISEIEFADRKDAEPLVIEDISTSQSTYHGAFEGAAVTNIVLPEGLTVVGARAFLNAAKLVSISFPSTLTMIGTSAFSGASALKTVTFAENTENFTSIGTNAFYQDDLESFELPDSVTTIMNNAFRGNTLSTFTIHETSKLITVEGHSLQEMVNLKEIYIPKGVTALPDEVFKGNTSMTKITFDVAEGELKTLGSSVFVGTKIESVAFPASLEKLGQKVFQNVTTLKSVTFGDADHKSKLTTIDSYAFEGTGLTSFTLPASVTVLSSYAFNKTANMTTFNFEEGSQLKKFSTTTGQNASSVFTNSGLTSFAFPDGFELLTSSQFKNCNDLTSITLPANYNVAWVEGTGASSATAFTRGVFDTTPALKEVKIADSNPSYKTVDGVLFDKDMKTILFYPAGKLDTAYSDGFVGYKVPDSVVTVGAYTFYQHEHLTKVFIPKGVTTIRNHAFGNAGNSRTTLLPLSEVVFEEGGTSPLYIGQCADVTKSADPNDTGNGYTFTFTSLKEFTVPSRTVYIAQRTFYGCRDLTKVTYAPGAKIEILPCSLYDQCYKLSTVNFPEGVKEVGAGTANKYVGGVFTNTGLTEIVFPDTVTKIGYNMFGGSANATYGYTECPLQRVVFPTSLEQLGSTSGTSTSAVFGSDAKKLTELDFSKCTRLTSIPQRFVYGTSASQCKIPNLATLKLPEHLETIGEYAFQGCKQLKTVELPQSLKTIGNYAFIESGLQSISIPRLVESIGNYAFSKNASLTNVEFIQDGNLETIGRNAFSECAFETITLPGTVKTLGSVSSGTIYGNVFEKNTALTEIVIPASVETFGTSMFAGCTNLQSVTFEKGSKITEIGKELFKDCKALASVQLPDGLISLGNSAFENTTISSVTLPDTLETIGEKLFYKNTGLTEITLPKDLSSLGAHAFYQTSKLEKAHLVDSMNLQELPANAFAGSSVQEVDLPDGMLKIGTSAFSDAKSLVYVSFGMGLSEIGDNAFKGCESLGTEEGKEFVIPLSVTVLGVNPFLGVPKVGLQEGSVGFRLGDEPDVALYSSDFKTLYSYPTLGSKDVVIRSGVETIAPYAFNGLDITSVTIPATVKTIGNYAFEDAKQLQTVTFKEAEGDEVAAENREIGTAAFRRTGITDLDIPEGFVTIGQYAFAGASLTHVKIGDTVTSIKSEAFNVCISLDKVELPASLEELGSEAFAGCPLSQEFTLELKHLVSMGGYVFGSDANLTKVVLPATLKTLASYAFQDVAALKTVEIDENATFKIDTGTFMGTGITSIHIPKGIPSIGGKAFYQLSNFTSITFAEGAKITSIGSNAFEGTGVKEIDLPASVTGVGEYAFRNCTELTTFNVPADSAMKGNNGDTAGTNNFGQHAFDGCVKLQSFTFPEQFNGWITTALFQGCTALETVKLADGITKIGAQAFKNSGITAIELPSAIKTISEQAFSGTKNLKKVIVPDSVTSIGKSGQKEGIFKNSGVEEVVIGDGISTFQNGNFEGCDNLQTVTLGKKITNIPSTTFKGCTALTTVILKGDVTTISSNAFEGCTAMTTFEIPKTVTTIQANAFKGWLATQTIVLPFVDEKGIPTGWASGWKTGCAAKIVYKFAESAD